MKPVTFCRHIICLCLCLCLLTLIGCATTAPATKSAETYFKEGEDLFASKNYEDAIAQWKRVKESYVSPELSTMAELKIADAQFAGDNYIEAAASYEDFRKLHPNHEKAAYALYRLGLCHYRQITGIDTDQTPVKNAVVIFESFLNQYPKSEYAGDVQQKLDECKKKQVQYEIYVGSFYLRSGKYKAAIKRLEETLVKYPGSPLNDETLLDLGKAYLLIGEKEKGRDAFNRLAKEFASSPKIEDARKFLEKYY